MSEHRRQRVLVLGLGNPIRRDDAVGLAVLDEARAELESLATAASPVTCRALCAGGFDLMYEVEGFDHLVVVDAFFDGTSEAGRVRTVTAAQLATAPDAAVSPHLIGLPEALRWSARAGLHTPSLVAAVVVEVGDCCMEFGEGLSEPVRAAVPEAASALCRIVRDVTRQPARQGRGWRPRA